MPPPTNKVGQATTPLAPPPVPLLLYMHTLVTLLAKLKFLTSGSLVTDMFFVLF